MLTLPTLVRRISQQSSDAPAKTDATSSASPTVSPPLATPTSPVVNKPLSAISRLGASFFYRKASSLTINGTGTLPSGFITDGYGHTQTHYDALAPAGGGHNHRQLTAQSRSARHLVGQRAATTATVSPPAVSAPAPAQGETEVGIDADVAAAVAAVAALTEPLVPHRPLTTNRHRRGSFAPASLAPSGPPRRPMLSKKMSASASLGVTRDALQGGSVRNLGHFDRSKDPAPRLISQNSSHSSSSGASASSGSVASGHGGGGAAWPPGLHAPFAPHDVLMYSEGELTKYEQQEILTVNEVYYYASLAIKNRRANRDRPGSEGIDQGNPAAAGAARIDASEMISSFKPELFNDGYDDERGDYVMVLQDHLGYRYEVLHALGSGSFGQVVCCLDHLTKTKVAVKVIRNRKKYKEQAMLEIRMLSQLQAPTTSKTKASSSSLSSSSSSSSSSGAVTCHHTVQMIEHFHFRNHLCITFELLGMNLYDYLKLRFFQGMPMANIQLVATQLLDAFHHLRMKRIIHCDLKPENILIRSPLPCFGAGPGNSSVAYANVPVETVCLIDFGSSCLDSAPIYTYIQSRFYRSPEVILGHVYNTAIDMWSLGCVLVELHTGHPLFAGENETEQLMCMMEILGVPSAKYLAMCKRRKYFFQEIQETTSINTDTVAASPSGSTTAGEALAVEGDASNSSSSNTTTATAAATTGSTTGGSGSGASTTTVYKPLAFTNSRGRKRSPGTRDLVVLLKSDDQDFIAFMKKCFTWDPADRLTPEQAQQEPWVTKQQQRGTSAATAATQGTDQD